jgi:hypothetical protein
MTAVPPPLDPASLSLPPTQPIDISALVTEAMHPAG